MICVGGLGMLVASDEMTDKDWPALSRAKGDVFMLVGATLYGFSTRSVCSSAPNGNLTFGALQRTLRRSFSCADHHYTKLSDNLACGAR